MNCPKCKNGTVFAYVFTCNQHEVSKDGEIGDPLQTATAAVWVDDVAACDTCEYEFEVDGDQVTDHILNP